MLKPSYGNLAALAPQPPRSASAMSPICNTLPTNLLEQCVEEFGHSRRRTKCKYFNVHEIHVRRFMITVEQNQRTGIRAQSCTESTYGDSRANLYTIYVRRLLRTFAPLRIPALVVTLFFFFLKSGASTEALEFKPGRRELASPCFPLANKAFDPGSPNGFEAGERPAPNHAGESLLHHAFPLQTRLSTQGRLMASRQARGLPRTAQARACFAMLPPCKRVSTQGRLLVSRQASRQAGSSSRGNKSLSTSALLPVLHTK